MFQIRRRRLVPNLQPVNDDSGYATWPQQQGLSTAWTFIILVAARLISAALNIVHDCDEVYNYWEPLHFLLYGYGMQTWEYSSQYALRSYLYLLLHSPVAAITAHFAGAEAGKVVVFYATKCFLGVVSAYVETALVSATRKYCGVSTSNYLLVMLASSCGMFTAATSLLPSSFAMYMVTCAAACILRQKSSRLIFSAISCVTLGWPVAGIALLPYALYVLVSKKLMRAVTTAVAMLALTLVPLVVTDRLFYGKWTVSLWNFIKYNVVGGGDSALYGTESATYYLRNGLLNLNIALPLALLAPVLVAFGAWQSKEPRWRFLVAISPVWVWILAISALPHKEERFLYVVYPLVCLSAAAVLASLRRVVYKMAIRVFPRTFASASAFWIPRIALGVFVLLSITRAASLVGNYGAPMKIYKALPQVTMSEQNGVLKHVCVGDEWHRFPSSFFLPSPSYRLAFVKTGFGGLLPRPFSFEEGGTASASKFLNDRNAEEPANYWPSQDNCDFLVTIDPQELEHTERWHRIASLPFMLALDSHSFLARVLYIPWYSRKRNVYKQYQILQKT